LLQPPHAEGLICASEVVPAPNATSDKLRAHTGAAASLYPSDLPAVNACANCATASSVRYVAHERGVRTRACFSPAQLAGASSLPARTERSIVRQFANAPPR
jgi:hypothetical protein